ncbi:MAG: ribonuclease III [Gammaproteobacteria bacterium]
MKKGGGADALHTFADADLRRRALTHASAGDEHNERLEWLGDALGDFLAADLLFARHPNLAEGPLTLARSFLVGDKNLASLARAIGLPRRLILSPAEERDGGRERDSILAGAMEAYMAAIYLDGGMDAARRAAKMLFADSLAEADSRIRRGALKDDKTRLQEYLQKRGRPPPQYEVFERGKIAHRPYCIAECRAENAAAVAVAENRRAAEQLAAGGVLASLSAEK